MCTIYDIEFYCQLHFSKFGKMWHSLVDIIYHSELLLVLYHDKKLLEISEFCSNYDYKYEAYDTLNGIVSSIMHKECFYILFISIT